MAPRPGTDPARAFRFGDQVARCARGNPPGDGAPTPQPVRATSFLPAGRSGEGWCLAPRRS
jgi:hypothetical protein